MNAFRYGAARTDCPSSRICSTASRTADFRILTEKPPHSLSGCRGFSAAARRLLRPTGMTSPAENVPQFCSARLLRLRHVPAAGSVFSVARIELFPSALSFATSGGPWAEPFHREGRGASSPRPVFFASGRSIRILFSASRIRRTGVVSCAGMAFQRIHVPALFGTEHQFRPVAGKHDPRSGAFLLFMRHLRADPDVLLLSG